MAEETFGAAGELAAGEEAAGAATESAVVPSDLGVSGLGSLRILWSNHIDRTGSLLTASSDPISVSNIKNLHIRRIWRTSSSVDQTLTVDLQSVDLNIRAVAIAGHNISSGSTVLVSSSENGLTWNGLIQQTTDGAEVLFLFFPLSNSRYWRISIDDPNNPYGYLEIGRVFLGDYWEPEFGLGRQWGISYTDPSEVQYSLGRQKWTNQKDVIKTINFHIPHLSSTEAVKGFLNILRRIGTVSDIFVSLTSGSDAILQNAASAYGRFIAPFGLQSNSSFSFGSGTVVFEKSI